jgi:hypothetical protein
LRRPSSRIKSRRINNCMTILSNQLFNKLNRVTPTTSMRIHKCTRQLYISNRRMRNRLFRSSKITK